MAKEADATLQVIAAVEAFVFVSNCKTSVEVNSAKEHVIFFVILFHDVDKSPKIEADQNDREDIVD